MSIKQLLFGTIICLCIAESGTAQMSEKPVVPQEMRNISSFVGEWENTATFYNQDREVQFKEIFTSEAKHILGGRAISVQSFNKDEEAGATWFFYEPLKEKYVMVAIDAWGNYDEFSGNFDGAKLVLTSDEREYRNGRKMIWRRTYTEFGEKRHVVKMHYSLDGGET